MYYKNNMHKKRKEKLKEIKSREVYLNKFEGSALIILSKQFSSKRHSDKGFCAYIV